MTEPYNPAWEWAREDMADAVPAAEITRGDVFIARGRPVTAREDAYRCGDKVEIRYRADDIIVGLLMTTSDTELEVIRRPVTASALA